MASEAKVQSDTDSNLYNSTQSSSLLNFQDEQDFMAEEELASNLILADFSSPKNSCMYSNSGFFDMADLPTLSNTPVDDANESID
ncbi:MAG: hypothetical protein ACMG6E_07345 [Candidatus Roizmanbacteria bacterium]